jgi:AraC-like DNA-binding protein
MQKAAMLLREGATLAKASLLTGYASEGSSSHTFNQWAGMTPGAYRRQKASAQASLEPAPRRRTR